MTLDRPDLVVFDVDGTLHDAFAWWAPVIQQGVARFAEEQGLKICPPTVWEAEQVVGMKDAGVWAPFLPEGESHRWRELRAVVLPMEVDALCSGEDYLFPGTRELLTHLGKLGVKRCIASNCRSTYMDAIRRGQGLGELSDWQFCLDSAGVDTKTDMLRLAMEAAGTGRAVMVGDREPDQVAARALGLPFIWRANGRCTIEDPEGVWHGDPDQLLALLGLPGIS
jgi:phosphoglycolate phosphatase-like HAD superfamily hydrolase